LTLCEHVGEGNFGIVYRARLHRDGCYSTVAVKMLKGCHLIIQGRSHQVLSGQVKTH